MDSPAKKLDFHKALNFISVLNLVLCTQKDDVLGLMEDQKQGQL